MKKIVTFIIACFFLLPVSFGYDNILEPIASENNEEVMYQEIDVQDSEIAPLDSNLKGIAEPNAVTTFKQPVSKRKIAKKFIIAMLCVVGCSIFLYVTLTLYNKCRETILTSANIKANDENSLATPTELIGAVSRFIEKTQW